MYRNLEAELARRKLSRTIIANELGITLGTLCLKLNGKANLTLPEAKKIKSILKCDMSIDYLFEDDEQFQKIEQKDVDLDNGLKTEVR